MKNWGILVFICLLTVIISSAQESGGYIAYVAPGVNNTDIFVADLATGRVHNLTNNQVQSVHPSWSGDGSQIVFNNVLDSNVEIFIMAANGLNQRNISNHPATDVSPDWSPVSDEIVFVSNRDGVFDLYIVDAISEETRRITTDGIDKNRPAWSPDGTQIAYWQSENGAFALKILTLVDDSIQTLVAGGENLWPSWSPDGQTIAIHSSESGTAQIYLVDVETGNRLQLTDDMFNNFRPTFSPDGEYISFISDRNGNNDLFTVTLDGSDVQPLIVVEGDDISPDWRAVSPEIDFNANPNLGLSAVQVQQNNVDSNETLGAGIYRVFAPPEANYEDYIRVRLEIELEDVGSIPEEDIPIREEGDITVYRYMGAEITGLDLEDFDIYPAPAGYLLQIQEDDVNYWEWYLQPLSADAIGRKLLFVEIYLPDIDDDGIVTRDLQKRIPITIDIVSGEPETMPSTVEEDDVSISYDSSYLQDDVNPDEPFLGFSI